MKPVRKNCKNLANKSTSGFNQPPTPGLVTRGKKVKTYGPETRLRKKRSKDNPSPGMTHGLRSRRVVSPKPPQVIEPNLEPPTLKRFDDVSLVGGVFHTVPQPGFILQPAEDNNIYIIVDKQEEGDEYDSSTPIIADVRSLFPEEYDLTEEEDKEKTRSDEQNYEVGDDDKPKVGTPPSKKSTVRRRTRKTAKDISNDIVQKASELKSKKDFLLKVQREFVALKNNSDSWHSIAMEIPNCWIFLETLLDSKHPTKH